MRMATSWTKSAGLDRSVLHNVASLYGAHMVNYVVPLATIPYLVRTLGASAWGLVAMAQGFGAYLGLVVEYGFNFSATREVARHWNSPDRIRELLAGVTGAKLFLAAIGIALAAALQGVVPNLQDHAWILWAGVASGVALGMNPLWYFQGRERMRVAAGLDMGAKLAAACGIFIYVHRPEDAWRVLALQAAGSILATGMGLVLAYRETPWLRPTAALAADALRTGWTMFLFRSSAMLYTSGNAFLLGLFAPAESVGYFAGAEKISKAFMGMLNPFNQALYPRISRLVKNQPGDAARLFRTNVLVVGAGGLALGAAVIIGAPILVKVLLGAALAPAVPVLRLLAVLPPLIGLNTVVASQWMMPQGMDRTLNSVILGAGVLNVCLAAALAPRYQQMGMAGAVVGAELFVGLMCWYIVTRRQAGETACPTALPDLENPA
jgi:PST family polysaccharide transporter